MKRLAFIFIALVVALSLLMIPSVAAGNQGQGEGKPLVVSKLGIAKVQGKDVIVDVLVVVPPGRNPNEAALEALLQQGARPFESAALGSEGGFTTIDLWWDQLPVKQNYNASNEPSNLYGQGIDALIYTHNTWGGVNSSYFNFDDVVSPTSRCPSLVRECRGRQYYDGNNDVAWMRLPGNILGVTWYGTSIMYGDEADMALNTRFPWTVDIGGYGYDVHTVFLHENGHVVGLGHSDDEDSIMFTPYQGVRRDLAADDEEGITYLYDAEITGTVSGIVVDDGTNPISGAHVELEGTSPLLFDTTNETGFYEITGVPDPVTYSITASASGFDSSTKRPLVDGDTTVGFTLTTAGGGGGGGQDPVVTECVPNFAFPMDRLTVNVSGENFQAGATVDFGQRVTVQKVLFIDAQNLDVKIKIHPKAAAGPRDVTVTNPDGQHDTLPGGFEVK
ncbi:matrixin family metalloprotease [Chloroflexota bacterium]